MSAGPRRHPSDDERIWSAIINERRRQDEKWGGSSHDDDHSLADWRRYICAHAKRASGDDARRQLVRVAALAVAAIQSIERQAQEGQQR